KYLNGTDRVTDGLGNHPVGILIYHPLGYVSVNLWSIDPGAIPGPADEYNDVEWALIGHHMLSDAGPLQVWEGSNETRGTLTHGPLVMSSYPKWVVTDQTRNYTVSAKAYEGRDVLLLWVQNIEKDSLSSLYWARAAENGSSWAT
ncbi:hypothetical protein GT037_002737, partial [Alternaria burnsii]